MRCGFSYYYYYLSVGVLQLLRVVRFSTGRARTPKTKHTAKRPLTAGTRKPKTHCGDGKASVHSVWFLYYTTYYANAARACLYGVREMAAKGGRTPPNCLYTGPAIATTVASSWLVPIVSCSYTQRETGGQTTSTRHPSFRP